jgi:plasmid maintenance system antidote protein VapI|tara:strand:+ start:14509 stop:14805 length:297 start_codon:yes stop_codon:yes gene_type:complete
MNNKYPLEYQPDYLVSFADMLAYEMEGQSISIDKLAESSTLTVAQIKSLLAKESTIDKNSAKALNAVLGRSVEYWLNIEAHYQQTKTRLAQEHQGTSE